MGYQNNVADHGVPEQWGRPRGTRTMGQTMRYQNNGGDHGVPEQWGRPWVTRTMGQTMEYQNNGGRPWGTRTMGADQVVIILSGSSLVILFHCSFLCFIILNRIHQKFPCQMGFQNNGADHRVPEQWGRPWDT